jgi:acyl-CoA dehydrogenase
MFDFQPTDEQRLAIDTAERFARHRIIPIAAECDRQSRFPREILDEAHGLGLVSARLPVQFGGPGLGHVDSSLVIEALAYGCPGIQASLTANGLGLTPLLLAGSDAQKRKYLGWLSGGPAMVALAASEPAAGSDLASIQCRASPDAGGAWVLHGAKEWVTNASLASFYVVFATSDPGLRQRGIGAFIVERDQRGVMPGRPIDKIGQRASDTASLVLDDVRIPASGVLAPPGHGFKLATDTFDRTRPDIAAAAVGLMRRCLDESVAYARQRTTFGVPIARHQLVAAMLADMRICVEATAHLARKAAWCIDRGHTDPVVSSCAKAFGADAAMKTAVNAVQVFGGNGTTSDYPVEKLMRDAKILQIYEGTSELQRILIARHMIGR